MKEVQIKVQDKVINGNLTLPGKTIGIVLFAHGSGSGRFSPRNNFVAEALNKKKIATLLMDLLTSEEELIDEQTAELRFDIPFLAERVMGTIDWLKKNKEVKGFPQGIFGASTGAAAALIAAAKHPQGIKAVVSRGGRPDLALEYLPKVKAPTLLIVGGDDQPVIGMNVEALAKLRCKKKLEIIPGATHLFEEPGKLEKVAELAGEWFEEHFSRKEGKNSKGRSER